MAIAYVQSATQANLTGQSDTVSITLGGAGAWAYKQLKGGPGGYIYVADVKSGS